MFALCPLTLLPCSPVEIIDAAAEAGFDAVGLRLAPTLSTDIDVLADKHLCREIEKKISSSGIKVLDIEAVRVSPDLDVNSVRPMFEYASGLGAQFMVVTGAPIAEWDPTREDAVVGKLRDLCELAARHSLKIGVEFMLFRGIRTLEHALDLRQKVGHPAFAITVDTVHFNRSRGTIDQLAAMDPAAFSYVQLCDGPAKTPDDLVAESRKHRLMPGEGDFPLVDIIKALPADITFGVEVPNEIYQGKSAYEKARLAAEAGRAVLKQAGR